MQRHSDVISIAGTSDTAVCSEVKKRKTGRCKICKRDIHLTVAGVLYKHGPGCAGSGELLVNGSVTDVDSIQQLDYTDSQPPPEITADYIAEKLTNKSRLLRRIPKASRLCAAEKLCQLLTAIIANSDNAQVWLDCLQFELLSRLLPINPSSTK